MEGFADAIKYYQENPEIKIKAEEILSKFDLGFLKFIFRESKPEDKKIVYIPTVPISS